MSADDSHCFSGMHPNNERSVGFVQELTRSLSLCYSAISQRSASLLVGVGAGVRSRFLGRTLGEQRQWGVRDSSAVRATVRKGEQ